MRCFLGAKQHFCEYLKGEGQNSEQLNFRMADISKLKINERVELTRVTIIENEIYIKR